MLPLSETLQTALRNESGFPVRLWFACRTVSFVLLHPKTHRPRARRIHVLLARRKRRHSKLVFQSVSANEGKQIRRRKIPATAFRPFVPRQTQSLETALTENHWLD